jgi:hypothetical protein
VWKVYADVEASIVALESRDLEGITKNLKFD